MNKKFFLVIFLSFFGLNSFLFPDLNRVFLGLVTAFSPHPVVFSKRVDRKVHYRDKFDFYILNEFGEERRVTLSKSFYQKNFSPHRFKVLMLTFMSDHRVLKLREFDNFLKYLCKRKILRGEALTIKVKLKDQFVRGIKCS